MKLIEWTDERGYKHRAMVRDSDSSAMAQQGMGIRLDPPDVEQIDWESVKRDLHNLLVLHSITNWEHIKSDNPFFTASLIKALKRHVITLFKETGK